MLQQRQLDFNSSSPLPLLPGGYIFQVYFPTIRIRFFSPRLAVERVPDSSLCQSSFFGYPPESCYVIRHACMHTRVLKGHPPSLSDSILYRRLARLPYTRHLIYFSQPFRANTRCSSSSSPLENFHSRDSFSSSRNLRAQRLVKTHTGT